MKKMKNRTKEKKGSISCHLIYDLEDGELDAYIENGRHPLPPFIKPKIIPKDAKKKRRAS